MKKRTGVLIVCFLVAIGCVPAQEHRGESTRKESAQEEYTTFRVGGYGEMVAGFLDYDFSRMNGSNAGAAKKNRGEISIPRFILAFDYKFNASWILGAEIEFEHGGTGVAKEIEYSDEGGEYETEIEKGGEVALEQFHITRLIHRSFNIRAGHIILPVGLTNAHHEPVNYFGTKRPEGESTIIPSTWHENGIAFFGSFGKGFDYEVQVVAGLDPQGFRRQDWVSQGKQGSFEVNNFSSPAFVGRLNYSGVEGLRLGVSAYYNKTGKNASKPEFTTGISAPVTILTADVQYRTNNVVARGNVIYGTLRESIELNKANKRLSSSSGFSRTPVAKNAVSYGGEAGYNIGSLWNGEKRIFPFVRYEYYNPQEKTEAGMIADKRFQTNMWTVGANYYALPNLVVKADYNCRRIGKGKYNDENEFSVGLAYTGWFLRK
ncbi:MAG: OprO/OprP family phosphate-selective porin [Mediterranea sp.]|jgi:hypothetical protein|nr:OprO/OprP family phosphate-selective porin [Mediterranea sp.]